MEINCPSCTEGVLLVDADIGKKIECPFCGNRFRVDGGNNFEKDLKATEESLNNNYCSNCGNETTILKAGHQRNCLNKNCLLEHFPRTDPAVIMLVHHENKALLGRQKIWPQGMYSTLAGFVEPGETLEHAVAREVFEEAGILIKNIQYHSSQPWPFPSSLMVGFDAEAKSTDIKINKNEIEDANWFSKEEIFNFSDQNKFLPRKISIARKLIDDWMKK